MMGVGHGLSGACAGLAIGNALQCSPKMTLLLGVAGAGAAALCDIDCEGSTASTAFPLLSPLIHRGCVELHYMTVAVIDPDDETPHTAHRGLTHWWPWWVFTGGGVALGCALNSWVAPITLIILFVLGIRAISIPDRPPTAQRRFRRFPYMHDLMMRFAYWLLDFTPLAGLKWLRKHTNRVDTHDYGLFKVRIPVGRVSVVISMTALVLLAHNTGQLPQIGPWLGALVFFGQWLHWLGDSPTEMGVPGLLLTRLVRLPKWIAFKAGGWFEVIFLWIPMGVLATYLLPIWQHPHANVMHLLQWVGTVLGSVFVLVTILTFITRRGEDLVNA